MAQKTGYSKAQIGLHWAIAALIGVNYIVSDDMGHSFDATLEGKTPEGLTSTVHIYVGLLVLALVVLRMVVRRLQGAPDAIPSDKPLMDMAARLTHKALYILMFVGPALGAFTWFRGVGATADLHVYAINAMMILIGLHAAAALFHQYIIKDGLLMRMLRPN